MIEGIPFPPIIINSYKQYFYLSNLLKRESELFIYSGEKHLKTYELRSNSSLPKSTRLYIGAMKVDFKEEIDLVEPNDVAWEMIHL